MRLVLLLVPVLFAMGCSQVPVYQRPDSPAPTRWDSAVSEAATVQANKIHWRQFFTDPKLQALIATALDNNRDVQISAARVREARARFAMANADKSPLVSVGPGPDTALVSGAVWPLLNVSYELDFWGRVAGMTESARMAYLASDEARRTVQLSLVADVASAYFEILQADELIQLTRFTVALRERSLDLLDQSRALGVSYDYEFLQAQGILESTRAALAAQQHQRAVATNRLAFLLGKNKPDVPPGRSLNEQGLDADLAGGITSEVLLLRPDVIASERRLQAANADIGVARAAFFPKVALTASVGSLAGGLASLLDGRSSVLNPGAMLPALFDGGRLEASLDAAEARKAVAIADYEKTILQAFREVADQISARASIARQMKAIEANALAQQERLRIAQARFSVGAIGYLEVIDAQREQLAAQQAAAGVRRAQLDAAVQFYKVLGGGVDAQE